MTRDDVLSQIGADDAVAQRLDAYVAILRKWNPKINLVAPRSLTELWSRHILDSAQLIALAPDSARTWADLGSGGGFPGAVVACLRPEIALTLVESDQRKAAFLRSVSRETKTGFKVLDQRIEDVAPLNADILSARALAPLDMLLSYAKRHLAEGGVALFPKGATYQAEVDTALANWRFTLQKEPSFSHPEAAILRIKEVSRV